MNESFLDTQVLFAFATAIHYPSESFGQVKLAITPMCWTGHRLCPENPSLFPNRKSQLRNRVGSEAVGIAVSRASRYVHIISRYQAAAVTRTGGRTGQQLSSGS